MPDQCKTSRCIQDSYTAIMLTMPDQRKTSRCFQDSYTTLVLQYMDQFLENAKYNLQKQENAKNNIQ